MMKHIHTPNILQKKSTCAAVLTAALAAVLTACGGGSDSTTVPGGTSSVSTPTSVPIQTTVPEPGYLPGSRERLAFDYLNQSRLNCGLGALRHNPILDIPAMNHARYIVRNEDYANPDFHPHVESIKLPGYTAPTPTDRALVAGYKTNGLEVGEIIAGLQFAAQPEFFAQLNRQDLMLNGIKTLMTAPYHAMAAFSAATEIGMAIHSEDSMTTPHWVLPGVIYDPGTPQFEAARVFMLGFGMDGEGQLPSASTGIRTYPCEGTTGVHPIFQGEWTDPKLGPGVTPGRNLGTDPLGTSIFVFGEVNKTLELTAATVTHIATGAQTPIYQLRTKTQDPMGVYYRNDWTGYVMPDKPLLPNERYRVSVSGKSGGTPFTKEFSFTTGASPAM